MTTRVVAHAVIAIGRMQFLVRRWKRTRRSGKRSGDVERSSADILEKLREPTEAREPDPGTFQRRL